jgi:tetratricopeptide (TPR) repeat protein
MSLPLLVEFCQQLPERPLRGPGILPFEAEADAPTGEQVRPASGGKARWRAALDGFKKQAAERYNEGTLLRLLQSPEPLSRRAAAFTLGLVGSMGATPALAALLHDTDAEACALAAEALWALWFHADNSANNDDLARLAKVRDREKALAGLDEVVRQAPAFAEAYHQRAVAAFRLEQVEKAAGDCQKALELNAHHFGAQAGLGRCLLHLRRHRAALKAFRAALRINPHLDSVAETVRALENALGEEGRRDDKK